MHIETLRNYCMAKPLVTEAFPFDDDTLVFKVVGKLFALISIKNSQSVNLKCDPEIAIDLRERYAGVKPGYHMNKKLWNTVDLEGDYTDQELCKWIDNSYHLVVKKLTKKEQNLFK